ncbi:MAG TPA: histidine kinase [Longimicrobium sp.]|nr:histidine kinase [Longimicrobium sp.]
MAPGALRLPPREVLIVLAAWTTFIPVFASRVHHQDQGETTWPHAFLAAAVDLYLWALVCLGAWAMARAFPLERRRWKRLAVVHLAGAAGIGLFRVLMEQRLNCVLLPEEPCFIPEVIPYRGPLVVFFYLQILGTMCAVEFARRLHQREVASARLERELTGAQLRALRAHLQPHFLFNTLNTVVSLVRRDPDGAEEMIGDLGDLLRASLVHEQTHEVTLREELALLEPYLRIHQVRFGARLRVERRVDAAALDGLVPPMVLQPLVENAIRHGIGACPRAGWVQIVAERIDGLLRLRVTDDGPGFASTWREGVGLGSTRERLRHQYAGEAALSTSASPGGGGVVEVVLPWRPAPDAEGAS